MNLQEYVRSVSGNPDCGDVDFGLNSPCQNMEPLESLKGVDSRVLFDQIYQFFDGQENGSFHVIGEFKLESLADCVSTAIEFYGDFGHQKSEDCRDERIKDGSYWRAGWYPFAFDECDNRSLVVDFDPTQHGTPGQIFLLDFRETLGDWLAPDLPTLLNGYHDRLIASKFVEDDLYTGRFAARVNENEQDC